MSPEGPWPAVASSTDVPAMEQHQGTDKPLKASLLVLFFFFISPLLFFLLMCLSIPVSKGTPQLARGQPAWVQRHSFAALLQGYRLQGYLPFERAVSASVGLIRAQPNLITHLLSDLQDTPALRFPE